MEAQKKEAYSPGHAGCTEEGLPKPSLKRMSRSLPRGIEERKNLSGGENKGCERECGGAGYA